MNFKNILKKGSFCLHIKANNKRGVIEELVDLLYAEGKIPDRAVALEAVLDRERRMSTGMQHGIAIPHGKTVTVDGLVTAFALKKEGVDFDSLDGMPSRIFIMTISTANRTGPHMQYLTEISKMLSSAEVRESLMNATNVDQVVALLTDGQDESGEDADDSSKG